jgi:putative Holliday junction resolvase
MSCFVGIDYGARRIGLAISDAAGLIASPLATITGHPDLEESVKLVINRCREYDVGNFVVGLALNMDDSEGPQARQARRFGAALAESSGRPVHFWDERLSSFAADELLEAGGLSRGQRKARRDRVAAHVILQEFLDARRLG